MKQYKRILEAIQKGLNFALDELDLEDNEEEFSLSRQLYKSKSMKLEYIENAYFVDLDLPSGTLWCKYNLGCDFDLLSSKPESTSPKDWYGNYYAWGEIKPKYEYSLDTYKYAKIDKNELSKYKLTKYCSISNYGYKNFTDNLVELLPKNDAAYKVNSSWKMPTKELCQELINYTNNKWISGKGNDLYMNVEGLAGRLFTSSKINGNQIFIPAAGWKSESSPVYDGSYCYMWSSRLSIDDPDDAWYLFFSLDSIFMSSYYRFGGRNIRAILR